MDAFAQYPAREARPERALFPAAGAPRLTPSVPFPNWPFMDTAPKVSDFGLHRIVPPEVTFERLRPFFGRIGITRIADITGLDRIGIPVYSAIVPRSRDAISVYHGKGFTPMDAKTGAVMEATERYVASRDRLPDAVASYRTLARQSPAIDPRSINQVLHPNYTDDSPVAWTKGVDLLSGDIVFVSHSLAGFCLMGYPWLPSHTVTTSNGLASGNSIEEAACHALTEIIERDAHSTMEVIHRQVQVIAKRSTVVLRESRVEKLVQERDLRYPVIDLDSLPQRAFALVRRFRAAGLEPILQWAGSECGACTVVCFLHENSAAGFSRTQYGVGADPDPAVAAIRALTEVAQGRAAYLEALREDLNAVSLTPAGQPSEELEPLTSTSKRISLASIPGHSTLDIVDDIRIMLSGLRAAGIERCVMVDLSMPEIPAKIVRLIAPGLESWIVHHAKVGQRAKSQWRQFAARVQ